MTSMSQNVKKRLKSLPELYHMINISVNNLAISMGDLYLEVKRSSSKKTFLMKTF